RVVSDDDALLTRLMPDGYVARPEQAIIFTVAAWDVNCPQHIPRKVDKTRLDALEARIAMLESENAALRALLTPDA
ncbi:hypothetical protein ACEV85_23490, partial [Vibrio parahaemolyticus]